jgi:hypothetical protein
MRYVDLDEVLEIDPQRLDIRPTGLENGSGGWVVQQGQQQVLHGHELMPLVPRRLEGVIQCIFQFFTQHWTTSLELLCLHGA